MTNREFASQHQQFLAAYTKAGVRPTKRQASKFKRGFGSAYQHRDKQP